MKTLKDLKVGDRFLLYWGDRVGTVIYKVAFIEDECIGVTNERYGFCRYFSLDKRVYVL